MDGWMDVRCLPSPEGVRQTIQIVITKHGLMPYGATLAVERIWRDKTRVITRRIQTHFCLQLKANVPMHLNSPTCWWRLSTVKWIKGKVDCHRLVFGRWTTERKIQSQLDICAKKKTKHLFTIGTNSVLDTSCTNRTHESSLIQPWPPISLNALLPSHSYFAVWAKQLVYAVRQQ